MISISYLKPLREACNIASVNHVTSVEQECLRDSAWKRVKDICWCYNDFY